MRRPRDLRAERGRRDPRRRREVERSTPLAWPETFAAASEARWALLVLLSLPSLTARRLLELAHRVGDAAACLRAIRSGQEGSEGDVQRSRSLQADDVAARLDAIGGRLIAVHEPEYPRGLLDLFDPPAGLFIRGGPIDERPVKVAVVGARNCSLEGKEISAALGRSLARAGACVVSGGARGIDAGAHRGALRENGSTICVLGSGLDVAYPQRNKGLLAEIAASGALVTEYAPGLPAEPFRFPARNRLVAALSKAIVVVEGATGSGSMITVNHALELGRDVFAVPGAVSAALSAVPLELIREGATLIRGPADLLEDVGLAPALAPDPDEAGSSHPGSALSEAERRVWEALNSKSAPDRLSSSTGLPLSQVIAALTTLELNGLVHGSGGRYQRKTQSWRP